MIKFYTAFTKEIDDPGAAAQEILEQLNPEKNMLKNTIGIIHFCHDFTKADIWQPFTAALPFELIGCYSAYISVNGQYGDEAISVTMITSDDAYFSVRTIDDMHAKTMHQAADAYTQLFKELSAEEKPKLVIPFLPSFPHFSCNDVYDLMNKFEDQLLLFGAQVFNMEGGQNSHFVMGNGKMSSSITAMIAFYGNVSPEFHINTSFFIDEIFGTEAEITDALGNILKSVNGIPALEYFKKQGLISEKTGTNIMAIPARIIYPNDDKISCAFLGIVEGTEFLYAARHLLKGSKIIFSHLDGAKALASVERMIKNISEGKNNNLIIFSSLARAWATPVVFTEMQKFAECALMYEQENGVPLKYSLAYSGGEICPASDGKGGLKNLPHNNTLSVCSFN